MPQLVLPLFPSSVTFINQSLAFCCADNQVYYFYGNMNPVFTHAKDDINTFKMIVSQFYVTGKATQAEICRAFGLPAITLKRSVKLYRESGPSGFYGKTSTPRGPTILTDEKIIEIENLLNEGNEPKVVAQMLNIKYDTLYKAIKSGKIKKKQ